MDISVNLTDKQRKAIKYLGYDASYVKELVVSDISARIDTIVANAKQRWLRTQTMDDIDPTPIDLT